MELIIENKNLKYKIYKNIKILNKILMKLVIKILRKLVMKTVMKLTSLIKIITELHMKPVSIITGNGIIN